MSTSFTSIETFFSTKESPIDLVKEPFIDKKNISLSILREDLLHPQISGNKFRKLKYQLLEAKQNKLEHLISFGGAFSNHLSALAYAGKLFGFKTHAFVRGEELAQKSLNSSLKLCREWGMNLIFVTREEYRKKEHASAVIELMSTTPNAIIIPEGGTNSLAVKGCAEILQPKHTAYDVICCSVGTGGTLAGLIDSAGQHQHVIGFSALKGDFLTEQVQALITNPKPRWHITDTYAYGGYAKTTPQLFAFIRDFETRHNIPLEPIYTGKMLYAIYDLVDKGYFASESKILAIHSGGLQGWNGFKEHRT